MTTDNATPELPNDPPTPNTPAPADTSPKGAAPKRKLKWIRRTLLAIATLVVLILVIIALVPTILSTGAGRTFVLGKVNEKINGKVTVTDWSIGWSGGIHANDLKLFDDEGRQILQIPRFTTKLSLLSVMRGQIHLGDTRVEGLDFFAERFANGTLNFAKLAKMVPAPQPAAKTENEKEAQEPKGGQPGTKLPVIDGELQLIGCRGTFQDDTNPDPKNRTVEFRTITADVKIASVNDPIEDSLSIVAYAGDGSQMLSFSASGTMQIAQQSELLTPGQMKITQKLVTSADLKGVQRGLGGMLPVQFTSGTVDGIVNVSTGPEGITVTPAINGKNVAYVQDGAAENVGDVSVDGSVNMSSPGAASTKDAVTNVAFSNLRATGVGSSVQISGAIEDLLKARKFNNLTVDLGYNLARLWDAYKPMLSKEQKESLKDVKVVGNKTERFVIGGSLPADKPFNEAIKSLTANGELVVESFDGQGASLRNLLVKIALADGKVHIPDDNPAADLNSGKFSLAGASVDLAGKFPTLYFPDKSMFLVNIELNRVFTATFLAGNPLFADPSKSTGQLSIEIHHCVSFPLGDVAMSSGPENQGVMEMNLTIHRLEIGNVLVAKIAAQCNATNLPFIKKLTLDSLAGDIDDFNVVLQHGISKQHLTLAFAHGKRPLKLAGTVVLASQMMDMQMELPLTMFGVKTPQDTGIDFPVKGPVNDPQFNLQDALKKNLGKIPGLPGPLKGLLDGGDNSTTKPANDDKKDPLKSLLNGLGKEKDK